MITKKFITNHKDLYLQNVVKIDTPLLQTDLYSKYFNNSNIPIVITSVKFFNLVESVFQKFNLFPHMTALENVTVAPISVGKVSKDEAEKTGIELLNRVGLGNKLDHYPAHLSGGQQQRLCIARAIATNPDVILMDEPCSALDPRATLQIEELMFELKTNYSIVIVTHNMQQAARASDHTVFLNMDDDRAGYVVEFGKTVDIFTKPQNSMTEDYVSGRFG